METLSWWSRDRIRNRSTTDFETEADVVVRSLKMRRSPTNMVVLKRLMVVWSEKEVMNDCGCGWLGGYRIEVVIEVKWRWNDADRIKERWFSERERKCSKKKKIFFFVFVFNNFLFIFFFFFILLGKEIWMDPSLERKLGFHEEKD